MKDERTLCHGLREILQRSSRTHCQLTSIVGKPRRMRHQVTRSDRSLGRNLLLAFAHTHRLPLRQILVDRIIELELSLFPERHGSDCDDRLGHRIDPKQTILRHGLLFIQITLSMRFEVANLTFPSDETDEARNLLFPHFFLHRQVELLEGL